MKRIICLIMVCLFALCALTACKKNGPTIMGNDGATYEQVVDKDGNPVTDPSGNPVVIAPKGTDASGNEQEDATQSLTIPYLWPRPAKRLNPQVTVWTFRKTGR